MRWTLPAVLTLLLVLGLSLPHCTQQDDDGPADDVAAEHDEGCGCPE